MAQARRVSSATPARNLLVLASGSPRRRELLAGAGIEFEVRPADIPEVRQPGEPPLEFARRLAREKALASARQVGAPARLVLGADTIVVIGDRVLGKPKDAADAVELLSSLVGRRHRVITGVAVADSETLAVHEIAVETSVVMRGADRQELVEYAASGEPLDKAGAYAVQGEGRRFIERVEGSETNVIGLPLEETLALLEMVSKLSLDGEAPIESGSG